MSIHLEIIQDVFLHFKIHVNILQSMNTPGSPKSLATNKNNGEMEQVYMRRLNSSRKRQWHSHRDLIS